MEGPQTNLEGIEKIKYLQDALIELNKEIAEQDLIHAADYLFKSGRMDLAGVIHQVALNDNLQLVCDKKTPLSMIPHDPAHVVYQYRRFGKSCIQDSKYNDFAAPLIKIRAAYKEDAGQYQVATKLYREVGMLDKSIEVENMMDEEKEFEMEDLKGFKDIIESTRNEFKDFVFLSIEEKSEIIENVKRQIKAELEL